ncbi:MAG TPA: peptidoglycan-binding domain-containing protein [Rhizobiaceae bacterium]|nr:peptidoglycan-binding domain-containing protein [Rhizobiaceae bacterium]
MAWRLAKSLTVLRDQINQLSPNRSKVSDGTIGDPAHSKRKSDHNPNGAGVVTALDLTNDPAHGIVSNDLALALVASRDTRIDYIISNGKIYSSSVQPWKARAYKGSNPHNKHVHISVKDHLADDGAKWDLSGLSVAKKDAAKPVKEPENPVLSLGAKGPSVERLQKALSAAGAKITADSDFGPKTKAAVIAFQKKNGLTADGVVGPYTWDALLA